MLGHVATPEVAMNLKREFFKSFLLGGALGGCAVGLAIVRAPSWMTMTAGILAVTMPALYEAWKVAKAGRQEVFADTPSQRRLVELGLIEVVSVIRPSPVGLPSPLGDVTLTFAKITPLGRTVLVESVRKEEGEKAANDMENWQPPGSSE